MTGRAAGFCAGYALPGYTNSGFGRGAGMGFGRGRGFGGGGRGGRNRFVAAGQPGWMRYGGGVAAAPALTSEGELASLKQQAEYFGRALEEIRGRIEELEKPVSEG